MPINFHNPYNRRTYAARTADPTWLERVNQLMNLTGKRALDIGCGGGIYTRALAELETVEVTAVDYSAVMLNAAKQNCRKYEGIRFAVGNALDTKLESEQYDFILERALTHHLCAKDLLPCFAEAHRLLAPGGMLMVQNRTPDDCLLPGSETHVRGYFFERFPHLADKESGRRHSSETICEALGEAGFVHIEEEKWWEVRRKYFSLEELEQDLLARTGRTILHVLSEEELQELSSYIKQQVQGAELPIVEQDRWTVWVARKQ